ncbi:cryptochrome/photolyase family protein [Methylophilus medardicus]|uniref:Cryptochrome/photolyase family protein n=1 Tax=Methylophilus medardicus TaxID=2588534 RepID=A0A5B8CTT7_9PROT|nr:cryptochrome/photolyase family protein [Methylophilus medardicus]QDC44711.1 cryptochrome/photolyase family protein [Methylophilus medardicus]QDC49718.1 cryptochrome/photolyase family protein [Methylophilus medardicus]QDC53423.1 cryptochrome/photolyase family protein [Methylophilus medardicus]
MRHLVIILGDQLSLDNPALADFDPSQDHIVMAEVMQESTHVWSHKQRITLFLSAMRHFAQALRAADFPLTYYALDQHHYPDLAAVWHAMLQNDPPQAIKVCEPGDWRVLQDLRAMADQHQIPLQLCADTHFMCSIEQFERWAAKYADKNSTLRMEFFYRGMRKKYNILMEGDAPTGGDWNYDHDNRQPLGKQGPQDLPSLPVFAADAITQEVMAMVSTRFADHPGALAPFVWPVNREQALTLLAHFITHKLPQFGPYQDAMWQDTPYLWHSLLASALNLKLLNPREVIAAAEQAYLAGQAPLFSVEGFIRQILGWREFVRGVYWLDMPALKSANFFQHQRALPNWFWTGDTHMQCLSQSIGQTLRTAYAHHIQRLMVIGLFSTLAELSPQQVSDWFLAVYVDAVEWVELPNVAGMALYANGGRFTSKPYIASGAYIQRMSNYCTGCRYDPKQKTGERACPFTTLYWAFLIRHEAMLAANPRTSLMVKHVSKMAAEDRLAITTFAEQRLQQLAEL